MHPRYEVEREYAVRILGELSEEQTARLLAGVNIEPEGDEDDFSEDRDEDEEHQPTGLAKFDTIEKRGGEGANQWYHVTIKEGRNREVRKMFEAIGLTVSRLMRVRFGKIELPPRLVRGKMMELDPAQVKSVLNWVGIKIEGATGPGASLPSRGRNEGMPAEEGPAGDRARRGRGRRKPRGGPRGAQGQGQGQGQGANQGANQGVEPGQRLPREPREAREADGNQSFGNEANGNVGSPAAGNGDPAPPAGDRPAGPANPANRGRARPRRNFRGGRNRRGPPKENAGNE
jgi:23S rRNA pseudouridine2605 synthase